MSEGQSAESQSADGQSGPQPETTVAASAGTIKKSARTLTGLVVSNKMERTITVRVERRVKHALYGKYMTKSSKIYAHDENNECNMGDRVTIAECRPLSKLKSWRLASIDEQTSEV